MKTEIKFIPLVIFLCVLTFWNLEAKAQDYLPVGPQTNVPVATVTEGGWTECYRDTYENHMDADMVLADCPGSQLMLACRETGSETLMLLAQGERSDVTFDTGNDNGDVLHIANGVGWYFNDMGVDVFGDAWGYVRAGDSVEKNNCDVDSSGANDERLCWHLHGNGGYRCGSIGNDDEGPNLNGGPDAERYERIVYVLSDVPPPPVEKVPTLSEWGLMAMAGVLGIISLLAIRRRKVTA